MNIDLLFTEQGEAGLIASQVSAKKIVGALLDTEMGVLSLEYVDMDTLELNITVERDFFHILDYVQMLHVGAYKAGRIAQAYQVPLMFLDDPYRGEALTQARAHPMPLTAFSHFIGRCVNGQPIHREDLGDEDAMGCILGDAVPSNLQFAPHLARRLGLEAQPRAQFKAPGPAAPGLGASDVGRRYHSPDDGEKK